MILLAALGVAPAHAEQELPRVADGRQAGSFLEQPDPAHRAAALIWFAANGHEADARRVAPRLHDDDPRLRVLAEQAMWLMWSRSGDKAIDRLFERGVRELKGGSVARAIATFGEVIRRKPEFAEGWNKRATAHFIAGDYAQASRDCDEVLRRNPIHFGALSGYGLIWVQRDDPQRALGYFRRALLVNPNMAGVAENVRALEALAERRLRSTI